MKEIRIEIADYIEFFRWKNEFGNCWDGEIVKNVYKDISIYYKKIQKGIDNNEIYFGTRFTRTKRIIHGFKINDSNSIKNYLI